MFTLEIVQLWVSMKAEEGFCHSDSEYERSLKRTTIEIMVDMAAWFGEKRKFFTCLGTTLGTISDVFLKIVQRGEGGGQTHVQKILLQIWYNSGGYLAI